MILLAEDFSALITEFGAQHLIVEPVTVTGEGFYSGFHGVAKIIKKGAFWEVDIGRGPLRSTFPGRLEEAAKKAGAIEVVYE